MYPIKFENLYYEKVWGGRDFTLFRDNVPDGNIGESWDVACHKNGTSVVANGEFKGKKLDELIKEKSEEIIGTKISKKWFPLLVKLINAKESLSVQVHPDDKYAREVEGEMGKTEVWYVVEAMEGASLIVGTKAGCTKDQIKKAIETGSLEPYMNKVYVKQGNVYFVKSGLIHAIGPGVIIAEIQQNSDTTYRVYDYGRGRELHINKALDVMNLSLTGEKSTGIKLEKPGFDKTYLCLCKEFSLEKYHIKSQAEEESDRERFYIFTVVNGEGEIKYNEGSEKLKKGDSILIPAALGKYTLCGSMTLLKSYVPDVDKVDAEILSQIKK